MVLLGAVGLSSWLGWLDYVLLPLLGIFIVLTAVAAIRLIKENEKKGTHHDRIKLDNHMS